MKTHVRMFKPQFAPLVEAGTKCQTIRPLPTRIPERFDRIDCRAWIGKPYRSKQRKLQKGEITAVYFVEISRSCFRLADITLASDSADKMATMDGFSDFNEMAEWFDCEHGLPFHGILITWRPLILNHP